MKDTFAQPAYIIVTESAANTLTYSELNIATELDKKKAFVIHRIEYSVASASLQKLIGASDALTFGLSLADTPTDVGLDQAEIFDRETVGWDFFETSGQKTTPRKPIDKRFTDMPGGGLLVPVKRLYGFCKGTSLATAAGIEIKFWYTIKELTDADYLQLLEAYSILK